MVRVDNWSTKLSDYLRSKDKTPFEWGENDCITFAAGAVEVLTGHNLKPLGLEYSNEKEAYEIVDSMGGILKIIDTALGRGNNLIMKAKRGDIAVIKQVRYIVGVVDDSGERIAFVSHHGLTRVPLSEAKRIWHI